MLLSKNNKQAVHVVCDFLFYGLHLSLIGSLLFRTLFAMSSLIVPDFSAPVISCSTPLHRWNGDEFEVDEPVAYVAENRGFLLLSGSLFHILMTARRYFHLIIPTKTNVGLTVKEKLQASWMVIPMYQCIQTNM